MAKKILKRNPADVTQYALRKIRREIRELKQRLAALEGTKKRVLPVAVLLLATILTTQANACGLYNGFWSEGERIQACEYAKDIQNDRMSQLMSEMCNSGDMTGDQDTCRRLASDYDTAVQSAVDNGCSGAILMRSY